MATCSWFEKKDWGRREAGHKAFLIHSMPLTQHDLNQLSQVGRPPPANVHRIYTRTWVTEGGGVIRPVKRSLVFGDPLPPPEMIEGWYLKRGSDLQGADTLFLFLWGLLFPNRLFTGCIFLAKVVED